MRNVISAAVVAGLSFSALVAFSATAVGSSDAQAPIVARNALILPIMNPVKGRALFASKGCVVCHAVNGIGGEDAPPLDASTMPAIMNPFDFAAKMWRGAEAMIGMQRYEIGEQINLTGEELANIIAFVHDADEQTRFTEADIPERIAEIMHKDE
ncbi:MAG: cytochrome c [Alphaproteobacteria bacterium]|nr:cytochrome c [Alphaproteobacteria bacterium]